MFYENILKSSESIENKYPSVNSTLYGMICVIMYLNNI